MFQILKIKKNKKLKIEHMLSKNMNDLNKQYLFQMKLR